MAMTFAFKGQAHFGSSEIFENFALSVWLSFCEFRSLAAFWPRLYRREGLHEPLDRAEWLPDALGHSYQSYGPYGTSYASPDRRDDRTVMNG